MIDGRELEVIADHREGSSGVLEALEALGVTVVRTTLKTGDYVLASTTRVERKTVRDLHASVVSGRFWRQLNGLRATSGFPVVLVEGVRLDDGPLSRSGVRGVLVALCDRGIPVVRSADPKDSAMWLRSLAIARSSTKRVTIQPPYRRPVGARDPTAVAMLCAIPGVSLPAARRLLRTFGSLREIANASPEALVTVAGVGARRSEAIHEAFNRPSYRIPRQRDPGHAT